MILLSKIAICICAGVSISLMIYLIFKEFIYREQQQRREREPAIRRFWAKVYSTESVRPSGGTMTPSPSAYIHAWSRQREEMALRRNAGSRANPALTEFEEFLTEKDMEIL